MNPRDGPGSGRRGPSVRSRSRRKEGRCLRSSNCRPPTMSPIPATVLERREWLRVMLSSIGDAVVTADAEGVVTFLNAAARVADRLDAGRGGGHPARKPSSGSSTKRAREPVESPAARALREGTIVGLANHSLLVARDGTERPIERQRRPDPQRGGRRRRGRPGLPGLHRTQAARAGGARKPSATPRRSWRRSGSRSWSSTAASGSGRPTPPSTGPSTSRRARRRADSSTTSATASGTSPTCGPCWRRRSPRRSPSTTSRSSTTSRRSAPGACCSTPGASRRRASTRPWSSWPSRTSPNRRESDAALQRLRTPVPSPVPDGQGRHPHPRRRPRHDHRGQPVHVRPAGLRGRGLPGQGTLADRPVPGQGGEPGRLRESCETRATSATSTCRSRPRAGHEVEVEFVSNLYTVGDRQVAQCNIRDITERSRMERQARAQATALADLHRRKDEFLAMLSHELRNPLSPILNAVHLLRLQGDENLIQQEARRIIERQVGQLARLVDDLLEVARFTSGKIRLAPGATGHEGRRRACRGVGPPADRRPQAQADGGRARPSRSGSTPTRPGWSRWW